MGKFATLPGGINMIRVLIKEEQAKIAFSIQIHAL
jgi:hypothetical protein